MKAKAAADEEILTLAQHAENCVKGIDTEIAQLGARKEEIASISDGIPEAQRKLKEKQAGVIDAAIAELQGRKEGILAAMEALPEEVRALEARALSALKHLF